MNTLVSSWTAARDRLRDAGVETPAFDARLLVEAGAGVTRMDILTDPHRALDAKQLAAIEAYVVRRERREPVAQILGKKAFWTFELVVTPDVLIPRPETEHLVAAALELVRPDATGRVLDLGIGSGAIAMALAKERPHMEVVGVDRSEKALDVARFNVSAHGLGARIALVHGDWGKSLPDLSFDLVVSNPPYVKSGMVDALAPEVARFEPRAALAAGPDGLDAFRALMPQVRRLLKPGGAFAFEIGQGQAEAVWALADAAGLDPQGVREDLAKIPRVVYGRSL